MMVYVQNKDGSPLMPTTRCGHVRILLKQGKARVVRRIPFTVRLLYHVEANNRKVVLGVDPGRTNIGGCAVTEDGTPLISTELVTRNKDIPKLMLARKMYRIEHRHLARRCVRQRRAKKAKTSVATPIERILPKCKEPIICHDIKNKEAKFCNRRRREGWLTPTARHLLQTHLNYIAKISEMLPITDIVIELNSFAFMAMENPNITKCDYQNGQLKGFGSVEDAVFAQQDGHCIFCKKPIDEYHHVIPTSKGGSNTLENRVGVCNHHHHLVHTDETWNKKVITKKNGLNKKYGALSVLNQIIPYLLKEIDKLYPNHVYVTDGRATKQFRAIHKIDKRHYTDAYCIACSVLEDKVNISEPGDYYEMRQFRRHDRQACHQRMIDRKYVLDGKVVATNRHKRIEQKTDSLEEFRQAHPTSDISKLTVKKQTPRYKNMSRIMPGSLLQCGNQIFVMARSQGTYKGKPKYYISTAGERYLANKCKLLHKNTGLVFVSSHL